MRPGTIIAMLCCLCAVVTDTAAGEVLTPSRGGEVVSIGSGAKAKDYVRIDGTGAVFVLAGPGRLSGWVRAGYSDVEKGPKSVPLRVEGLPSFHSPRILEFKSPSKVPFTAARTGRPSVGVRFGAVAIPAGRHELRLFAEQEPLYVRLLWQPARSPGAAAAADQPTWKSGGSVGLETIYDDNFLRYSDDYLDEFLSGAAPYKFKIDRKDSHIFAPHVELYAQRRLIGRGDTRFRFRVKRWQYVQGHIKSNMSFDYGIRQFFAGGKSLEFGYQYAPQQYIRELSDRSPLAPPSDPLLWEEFRYTRNVFLLTWRQKLRRRLSLKLAATRSLRYYNQPFMENDIKDLGLRGTLGWSPHRNWRLTLDYGFTDAPARGADEAGETIAASDNSDPSYQRDLYQFDLRWRPRWTAPLFDYVSVRGQHQIYRFTSAKDLFDDPFHVGRIDRVYMAQLDFDRRLAHGVDMNVGVRYTKRTVDSPWQGNISEDKDYEQRRYWIGLTYKL